MDYQHTNQTAQSNDEPDDMLPPVSPVQEADSDGSAPVPVVPPNQTMTTDSALIPMPDAASDTDLIEKEWVLKAKQIVEHTSEDPFNQVEELNKIKIEYLKKRYNRDIGAS